MFGRRDKERVSFGEDAHHACASPVFEPDVIGRTRGARVGPYAPYTTPAATTLKNFPMLAAIVAVLYLWSRALGFISESSSVTLGILAFGSMLLVNQALWIFLPAYLATRSTGVSFIRAVTRLKYVAWCILPCILFGRYFPSRNGMSQDFGEDYKLFMHQMAKGAAFNAGMSAGLGIERTVEDFRRWSGKFIGAKFAHLYGLQSPIAGWLVFSGMWVFLGAGAYSDAAPDVIVFFTNLIARIDADLARAAFTWMMNDYESANIGLVGLISAVCFFITVKSLMVVEVAENYLSTKPLLILRAEGTDVLDYWPGDRKRVEWMNERATFGRIWDDDVYEDDDSEQGKR